MTTALYNYSLIEQTIATLSRHKGSQIPLEALAKLLPNDLEDLQLEFNEWAGVNIEKFMFFISKTYTSACLKPEVPDLFNHGETDLHSDTAILHGHLVSIELMNETEVKNGGINLHIDYGFYETLFGRIMAASTTKGLCQLVFSEDDSQTLQELKSRFPNAVYKNDESGFHVSALRFFRKEWEDLERLNLHLSGTPFQLKVWNLLLKLPMGRLRSYTDLALQSGNAGAARAVGNAVGNNVIAFIIPCHRVIKNTGEFTHYRWGAVKKTALIGWEAAQNFLKKPGAELNTG